MSEEHARQAIAAQIVKDEERIARAVGRGGLPTEAEAEKIQEDLARIVSDLELLESRVAGIALSDTGDDLPFPVTLEAIGVLAVLVDEVESHSELMAEYAGKIRSKTFPLDAIRLEQRKRSVAA